MDEMGKLHLASDLVLTALSTFSTREEKVDYLAQALIQAGKAAMEQLREVFQLVIYEQRVQCKDDEAAQTLLTKLEKRFERMLAE